MVLLLARVRRVVGAQNVDNSGIECLPDRRAMARIAHRRVHLHIGALLLVALRPFKRQMMRRHFDGREILVAGEIGHFVGGRNVQHMHAAPIFFGESDEPLGRHQRGLGVAPLVVRCRIASAAQSHALLQARFILGVE